MVKTRLVLHGRRLRGDTTVVETNIHYPTDAHGGTGAGSPAEGGMSGERLEIEPHNCPRIDDLGGGRYLTIPHRRPADAVTINPVSTKSGRYRLA